MEPVTSQQELKALLDEGKITPEEYQQLLEAMRGQKGRSDGVPASGSSVGPVPQKVPWPIWVVAGILILAGIGDLLTIFQQPIAIGWLLAKVIFIIGLLKAWKWVFVAFQIIAGIHVLYFACSGMPVVAFLNLILIVLCFVALRYYFPAKMQNSRVIA